MENFVLFASPWWVNLLILVPIFGFYWFGKNRLALTWRQLCAAAIFGIAFGYVEASVVVYLRAALGFLPGFAVSLSEAARQSFNVFQQTQNLSRLPTSLLQVEFFRNVATIVMIMSFAWASAKTLRDRFAMFLWVFAFWDIFYYVWLFVLIRWPYSLTTPDVLFLVPVPWLSQVWFPLLVSSLCLISIASNLQRDKT